MIPGIRHRALEVYYHYYYYYYAMQHSEHVGQHNVTGLRMTGGAIGAAEQIVHNNNNKIITQQGESQTKLKKFKKSFEKVL